MLCAAAMSYSVATGGINFGTATSEPLGEDAWGIDPVHAELTSDETAGSQIWATTELQPSSAQHAAGDQMQSMPQAEVAFTEDVQPPAAVDEPHGTATPQPTFASSAADDAKKQRQDTSPAADPQHYTAPHFSCEDQNALSSEARVNPIGRPGQSHDRELPVIHSHEASAPPTGHVQESLNSLEAKASPDSAPMGSNVSLDDGAAGHNGNDLASNIQKKLQPGSPAGRAAPCISYANTTYPDTVHLSPAHSPSVAEAR